jgi:hypothetical protein
MGKLAVLTLTALSLVAVKSAEAVPIVFSTTGTFSSPTGGCTAAAANTISCGGYTLTFASTPTVQDVPFGFTSVVNFGNITTTGSNAAQVNGGGTFNLQIIQTVPSPLGGSPFSYTGNLTAELVLSASNSYLLFSGPFNRTVFGTPYDVAYNLTEADRGTMGRSDISGTGQAPLDINGTILPVANVPEPASIVLIGSGLFGLARKLRKKSTQI